MFRSLLRMLKHILFAVIAIIATVCITEVGLRGHSLYQRCQDVSAEACTLVPVPCPSAYQQLPPFRRVARPAAGRGEPVVIRTNSFGLRGDEVAIPKPADVYRIICLGDDATLAPEIPEDETFVALVNAMLTQQTSQSVEVINAGVPGHCPLLSLAWARQRLAGLQPDLVILCCDQSDVSDDRHVRPLARYATDGSLQGVCHPAAAQRKQSLIQAIEQEFQLAALVREHLDAYLTSRGDASSFPDDWETPDGSTAVTDAIHIRQAWEPIAHLRDLCERLTADFVVVLVPTAGRRDRSTSTPNEITTLLSEITEELGVPYLDVTPEFPQQASPALFLEESGALSSAGHQAFADLLSWAVIDRDAGLHFHESSPAPVTHASAESAAAALESADPTPLPSLGRRPRTSSDTAWSR